MAKSATAVLRTVAAPVPAAECMPLPCRAGHATYKRGQPDFTRVWAIRAALSDSGYNDGGFERARARALRPVGAASGATAHAPTGGSGPPCTDPARKTGELEDTQRASDLADGQPGRARELVVRRRRAARKGIEEPA